MFAAQQTKSRLKLSALLLPALILGCPECEDPSVLATTYDLCLTPAPLDYGQLPVRTGETKTAVVVNCGGISLETLEIRVEADDPLQQEAFSIVETEVAAPLSPGARFVLPVRFFARTPGVYSARALFFAPDRVEPIAELPFDAEALALATCDPIASPDPLDFGALVLGDAVERSLTITNQGLSACSFDAASVVDGQANFEVSLSEALAVPTGESVDLSLSFAPTEEGALTGRLSLVAGGEQELLVGLRGEGISPDRCALVSDPPAMIFARAAVAFSTSSASATITSVGALGCEITNVTTEGDFTVTTAPSGVLAPDATAGVDVTFSPLAPGSRTGALVVEVASGETLAVPLVGFADPTPSCGLAFNPAPIVFDPLAVGLEAEIEVSITNVSELPCDISGGALDARAAPDLALIIGPTTGVLAPGASTSARVRFTPQAAAPALSTLSIDAGGNAPSRVDIIGFADFADVVVTPGFRFFGFVTEGCVSRPFPALLSNTGPVAARIDDLVFSAVSDPNFELMSAFSPGTLLGPGSDINLDLRMRAGPTPGPHSGQFQALATGTVDRVARAQLTGTTESLADAARTDVFRQGDTPQVDILFVVDDSGSMQQEQTNIAQNFSAFIQFTTELDIDYHIGVVTTDVSRDGELVAPFIANVGPNSVSDPVAAFVTAVNVGTTGSATEKGLESSVLALTEPTVSGANAGFLREGALLALVYVSDEEDFSPGDVGDHVDQLLAVKGYDADAILASAIAGDVPGGCDRNGNSATAGSRYFDASVALGGLFASICTPDWATTMEQIGLDTFSALTRFTLSRVPDTTTIVVTVGPDTIPEDALNGWSYDPETNSIRLNGTSAPEAGNDVIITYTAECIVP